MLFRSTRPTGMIRFSAARFLGGVACSRLAKTFALTAAIAIFLIGCANENTTDYRRADFSSRKPLKSHHAGYELSDTDVIGASAQAPTDEDIRRTLDRAARVEIQPGETVLVLQSGEPVPDARMVSELNKHFRAVPFSGIRSDWSSGASTSGSDFYAKALRFAAAQAGATKILCFWGSLEVAHHDLSTKTITWLPVVDIFVPDQKDRVRVHLKMAVVDVRSGAWNLSRTEPQEAQLVSTGWGREHTDTIQVRDLKQKSYEIAVNSLASPK
jgi:hypothetical protein